MLKTCRFAVCHCEHVLSVHGPVKCGGEGVVIDKEVPSSNLPEAGQLQGHSVTGSNGLAGVGHCHQPNMELSWG